MITLTPLECDSVESLRGPVRLSPLEPIWRAWSIWEVYENKAYTFLSGVTMASAMAKIVANGVISGRYKWDEYMPDASKQGVSERLDEAVSLFDGMGARASRDYVLRVKRMFEQNLTVRQVDQALQLVLGTYADEMASWHVLLLNEREAVIYDHGEVDVFGQEVVERFPSAVRNMAEACKCFVLNRWTACAYHCMGVAEVGIKALCGEVNATIDLESYDTTWEKMRKAVEAELLPFRDPANNNQTSQARRKASHPATWDEDEAYFFGLVDDIRAIQRAYRNTSMHFRVIFDSDEKQAKRVLDSTAGFMQDLALRVRES